MSNRPLIVIPGDDPPQCQGSPQLERLKPYGDVKLFDSLPQNVEEQIERAKEATALINSRFTVKWPAEILRQLPKLEMFTLCGIGTDSIDLNEARARRIVVSNVPGKTAPIVAEHALGLMFAAAKRAAYQTAAIRAGKWTKVDSVLLQGKTLGIIGTGNIGTEMARLGKAIGMNVIAWTFHPSPKRAAKLGVHYVGLDELLMESDVVTLHVALTAETRHLIGKRELGIMKQGALLVNVARGEVVNQGALVDALNSGHLGGAGLDVYEEEPLPVDSPLLSCEQVVLTPHLADMTPEGIELLNEGAVENVIAFFERRPQNVVT
ncbi:MAG: NAD(P)-dependent oxidoreductase [Chloroflexi bacterium]|nr:NAD(P)-dependent oxidoreductase [Chloroflexota bacterium]